MINRLLYSKCLQLLKQYPVLTITGPRQSGKTTLAKALWPDKKYVTFEAPDIRNLAITDPRKFLNNYKEGAIFDEIQRTPDIPSYIQEIVDEANKNSLFILTGSQQFEISQTISQSLAGRTALIRLLPLSLKELSSYQEQKDLNSILLNGFYPRLHVEKIEPFNFFSNYFETYVERDLRQLSQIDNLMLFERFVRVLAGRVGTLLNYNSLASDLGISQPTIKKWISLLEASYIVFILPPYYNNAGKRMIKTPKIYFYDTGLVCYLLGIEKKGHLNRHPLYGGIFENFVVIEFLKERLNQAKSVNLYFYRDRTGHEVDLVLEQASNLVPVEIKAAETLNIDFEKGVKHFQTVFKNAERGKIIYAGKEKFSGSSSDFLPWRMM